jgi:hypothetical protein
MLNLFIYAFMAIVTIGALPDLAKPKRASRNIGKRRARAAKRQAEYARLETQRAVTVPVQTKLWID